MPNPITQFQIITKTPNEAAEFYSNLFGWTMDADNPMGYRRINTGTTEGIQGGIWPAPPQAPDFVQFFVTVSDVKKYVQKGVELGGKLIVPPTILPDGEEMAVMHDPGGISFVVWHTA